MSFVVVICVGPDPTEVDRVVDCIRSIAIVETEPIACVLVDDCPWERHLLSHVSKVAPPSWSLHRVVNPRMGQGFGSQGGLCAGVLAGLQYACKFKDVDFILKLDTDTVAFRPFRRKIHTTLSSRSEIGVLGTVGKTCRRDLPGYGFEKALKPWLIRAYEAIATNRAGKSDRPAGRVTEFPPWLRKNIMAVVPDIEAALSNGYRTTEYCQGGAYVISVEMLRRMAERGFLEAPVRWIHLRVGEDKMMGMYARAIGLTVYDLSDVGQPFGIQWQGLAYPPNVLVARGYSFAHSIKSDASYSEGELRHFFHDVAVTSAAS